jgi:hypothetical protein
MMMMILPSHQIQNFVLKHKKCVFLPQHTGPSLVLKSYSFVYLNFNKISIQIMKKIKKNIPAGWFQFILKEHK